MEERQDLISRQVAIDLVKDVCDAIMSGCESWYDPETEDEVYKDIREVDAILKCNKEIRIALRNMPPSQPDNQIHLCDSCGYSYPECPSESNDVIFGNGNGNDNICACGKYKPSAQKKGYTKADYIMALHKEYGCSLARAEEAHQKSLEYLRNTSMIKG